MKLDIVSANRLTDGHVVYLTRDGDWSESIVDGRTAATEKESSTLLADAERAVVAGIIVSPYRVSIADDGAPFHPCIFVNASACLDPKLTALQATQRAGWHKHVSIR